MWHALWAAVEAAVWFVAIGALAASLLYGMIVLQERRDSHFR